MKTIAIDAGHYKYEPGRRIPKNLYGGETREWELNRRVAEELEKLISNGSVFDFVRIDDRTGETLIGPSARASRANYNDCDYYISIHHNAGIGGGSGGGCVVLYYPTGTRAQDAEELYECIVGKTGLVGNRYDKIVARRDLTVLKNTKMPALLVECGFMDSATDVPVILDVRFAEKCAIGIYQFLMDYFQIDGKTYCPTCGREI